MGCSKSILTQESYPYTLSHEMTQVAWVKHGTGVSYPRQIDG